MAHSAFSGKESTPTAFLIVQCNETLFCHQITMTSNDVKLYYREAI